VNGFASPGKLGESNGRWLDVLTVSARSKSSWEQALRITSKVGGNSFHITKGKVSNYSISSCWRLPGNS